MRNAASAEQSAAVDAIIIMLLIPSPDPFSAFLRLRTRAILDSQRLPKSAVTMHHYPAFCICVRQHDM